MNIEEFLETIQKLALEYFQKPGFSYEFYNEPDVLAVAKQHPEGEEVGIKTVQLSVRNMAMLGFLDKIPGQQTRNMVYKTSSHGANLLKVLRGNSIKIPA